MLIAIQPDDYGEGDSASPLWTKYLQAASHTVRPVDVYRADILDQLRGCHGFMWRHAHLPHMRQVASRLFPVLEHELQLAVYPDQCTCWHYDDKIAQAHLFAAKQIPSPRTWVWFDRNAALEWSKQATYPIVLKLWSGAGSTNVRLIKTYEEAKVWILKLFGYGVGSLDTSKNTIRERILNMARVLVKGTLKHPWELHKNYVLFQEFLPGNDFDTRITVIGERAFGFRRFNRDNDFRASGSGKIDHSPERISHKMVQLAFDTAEKLKMQSCAIDGLWRGDDTVVGEVSYTYASWAVHQCPGHWDRDLNWHEGQMWPEEAQVTDFLARLAPEVIGPKGMSS